MGRSESSLERPLAKREQSTFPLVLQRLMLQLRVEVFVQVMVTGPLVLLAAFLVQPHPGASTLNVDIFYPHLQHRTHAGEGVHHQGDERPTTQADKRREAHRAWPGFVRGQHGCQV